jgi:2-C-methyl-D-erythritol 4-phosphate cytidylyltransferase
MQNKYAIILAGGTGTRAGSELPKQFVHISGKPLIIHTLQKFNNPELSIIVVVPSEFIDHIIKLVNDFLNRKILKVIAGGETRQGSAYNAIKCIDFSDEDILLFHDAARPFVSVEIIEKCINEAMLSGAAGVYVRTIDTIAEIQDGYLKDIPFRNELYYTQTPQAFKYRIIKDAHEFALSEGIFNSTDDAGLVLNAGYKVKIIEGDYSNIKITTPEDMEIARYLTEQNV